MAIAWSCAASALSASKSGPSRMGRNPRTGEPVSVGQKRAPFFRTGKELRERLNGGTPEA